MDFPRAPGWSGGVSHKPDLGPDFNAVRNLYLANIFALSAQCASAQYGGLQRVSGWSGKVSRKAGGVSHPPYLGPNSIVVCLFLLGGVSEATLGARF